MLARCNGRLGGGRPSGRAVARPLFAARFLIFDEETSGARPPLTRCQAAVLVLSPVVMPAHPPILPHAGE